MVETVKVGKNLSPTERRVEKGLSAVLLMLVLGIAYTVAQLTWFMVSPEGDVVNSGQGTVSDRSARTPAKTAQDQGLNISKLQSWHLFGRVGIVAKEKPARAPAPVKAPETTLRLALDGVFRADIAADSTAIIAEKGKEGKLYRVGERLPGNAVLEAVHEDRVLLKRNGRLETLRFPEVKGITSYSKTEASKSHKGASNRRTESLRSAKSRKRSSLGRSESSSRTGRLLSNSRDLKPDRLVKTFSEDFQDNPQGALDDLGVNVLPMTEGGGYQVSDNVPPALMRMAGLRRGDILRSVNGQSLGNIMADQALYQQLLTQDEVTVEVERGSRRFTVTIPVPKL